MKTDKCSLKLLDYNIIRIQFTDDAELDLAELKKIRKVINGHLKEAPYAILALPGRFTSIDDEAKKYAADPGEAFNRKAIAIKVVYLHHRLMTKFFINVIRPKSQTRLFKSEKDAHKWLVEIMKNELSATPTH